MPGSSARRRALALLFAAIALIPPLAHAARHPGAVAKPVLVTTSAGHEFYAAATAELERKATPEQKRTAPSLFEDKVTTEGAFRRRWDGMLPLHFVHWNDTIGREMLERGVGNPRVAAHMFAHVIPRFDVRPHLAGIAVPTLVAAGRGVRIPRRAHPTGGARRLRGEQPLRLHRGTSALQRDRPPLRRRLAQTSRGSGRSVSTKADHRERRRDPASPLARKGADVRRAMSRLLPCSSHTSCRRRHDEAPPRCSRAVGSRDRGRRRTGEGGGDGIVRHARLDEAVRRALREGQHRRERHVGHPSLRDDMHSRHQRAGPHRHQHGMWVAHSSAGGVAQRDRLVAKPAR